MMELVRRMVLISAVLLFLKDNNNHKQYLLCDGSSSFSVVKPINLLLLGDSFDRLFQLEWCTGKQDRYKSENQSQSITAAYPVAYSFGDENLHIKTGTIKGPGPISCVDYKTNDSVASLYMFGSGEISKMIFNIV